MYYNKLILGVIVLLTFLLLATTRQKQEKIYFIDNDSLVQLNGKVKQMFSIIEDSTSFNQGQDFDTIKFDKKGDVNKIINGFHGSIFRDYYKTKYSEYGQKLETIGYIRPNDAVSFISGFPSETLRKPVDTSWENILAYKYDEQGLITQYVLKGKNHTDNTIYKYNAQGNVIESDYYFNPTLLMDVTKYVYDNSGNLIEHDGFHRNALRVKIKYDYNKFDSNNNWLEETVHLETFWIGDQVKTFKMHREITYY